MNAPKRGRTFFNPWGPGAQGLLQLLRWKLGAHAATWPRWVDNAPQAPAPEPGPGEVVVQFINHATLLLRFPGLNLITDPVFSERTSPVSWAGPKRVRAPGLALEDLPTIHGVLLSHNHYDHLDRPSLRRLGERDRPWVATPLGVSRDLKGLGLGPIQELDWWQSIHLGGAEVTCTPARHFSGRGLFDRDHTLWGGLHVKAEGRSLYFAGDTAYAPFFSEIRDRLGAPDLALLPIGAYAPRSFMAQVHMDPQGAVRAHQDLGATRSLGMHWGTWQLTDEGLDEPVREMEAAREAAGLSPETFQVLPHGGWLHLR
jgi:L-ascorbate metabolism protein UlaG (beta-lactamase superfamily)